MVDADASGGMSLKILLIQGTNLQQRKEKRKWEEGH